MLVALESALDEKRPIKLRALDGEIILPCGGAVPLSVYAAIDISLATDV
jgi:hypothetical protein